MSISLLYQLQKRIVFSSIKNSIAIFDNLLKIKHKYTIYVFLSVYFQIFSAFLKKLDGLISVDLENIPNS